MKCSSLLIEKIKQFEGCSLKAYRCPAGVATIGYGHTGGVRMGVTISQDMADLYLDADVTAIELALSKLGYAKLSQHRWDALVDFVFNLGIANFKHSTLRRKIDDNVDDTSIPDEFRKWCYAKVKGKKTKLVGLVKRREWEARRWGIE